MNFFLKKIFERNPFKKVYFPLKIRILVIIIFPVISYPFLILYFNKYQEILITSEFKAMERQGLTFAKAIGIAENQYGLIEKNRISGAALKTLLSSNDKNFELKATLFNTKGELVADSDARYFSSKVEINQLPIFENKNSLEKIFKNFVRKISKIISQPINLMKYNNRNLDIDEQLNTSIKNSLNGKVSRFITIDDFKNLKLNVSLPIKSLKVIRGVVIISSSGDNIEKEILNLEIELFKTLGIILFATVLLAIYLIKSITNPIIKLSRVADHISKNKLISSNKLLEIPRYNDEIGKLSSSFETMISEIQKRVNHIESFAADVAHELKNPLTSLRSASETFLKSKTKTDQKKMIDIILEDIQRIDRLITDISFSSKLDADLVRVKFNEIDINELLHNYVLIRLSNSNNKINFQKKNYSLKIYGSENKLVQVFDNILDNSITITRKNCKIKIKLFSEKNKIIIQFDDNGPGFPSNAINKVFDRFYTDRINQNEFGKHSGLGLSISKQIISAHDGNIFVENLFNSSNSIVGARVNIILNKIR